MTYNKDYLLLNYIEIVHQENSLIIILQHFKLKLTNNTGRETTGSSN